MSLAAPKRNKHAEKRAAHKGVFNRHQGPDCFDCCYRTGGDVDKLMGGNEFLPIVLVFPCLERYIKTCRALRCDRKIPLRLYIRSLHRYTVGQILSSGFAHGQVIRINKEYLNFIHDMCCDDMKTKRNVV